MADRSFEAASLVTLPRLNVNGAIALGTEIETVVKKAGKLPTPINKAAQRLGRVQKALRAAAAGRLLDPADPGTEDARKADQVIDAAWRAAFDWTSGWAELPLPETRELASKAQGLLRVLYADGLKFTQLPYKLEHSESQTRIDRIDEDGLGAVFDALGGGVFLDTIRKAHKLYGKALGLTQTKGTKPVAVDLRGPMDDFYEALRVYVIRVSASVEEDEPETQELADVLLAPVMQAESLGRGPAAPEPDPKPADAGQPGAK